jgi:hypothetical protein
MNDKIVNVTFPKCGSCRYAQKFDAKDLADCYGEPPTVMNLGATQDVLGRPGFAIEAFVPRIHRDRPACSRHVAKVDFATLGRS